MRLNQRGIHTVQEGVRGRPQNPAPRLWGSDGAHYCGTARGVVPGAGNPGTAQEEITASRSFGRPVIAVAELQAAVAHHLARATATLRCQRSPFCWNRRMTSARRRGWRCWIRSTPAGVNAGRWLARAFNNRGLCGATAAPPRIRRAGRRAGGLCPGGLIHSQAVVMCRSVIFAGIGQENFLVIWEFQAVNRELRMNPPGG